MLLCWAEEEEQPEAGGSKQGEQPIATSQLRLVAYALQAGSTTGASQWRRQQQQQRGAMWGSIDFGAGWLDASGRLAPFRCLRGLPLQLQPLLRLRIEWPRGASQGCHPPRCWVRVSAPPSGRETLLTIEPGAWLYLQDGAPSQAPSSGILEDRPSVLEDTIAPKEPSTFQEWTATPTLEFDTCLLQGESAATGRPESTVVGGACVRKVAVVCSLLVCGPGNQFVEVSGSVPLCWEEL